MADYTKQVKRMTAQLRKDGYEITEKRIEEVADYIHGNLVRYARRHSRSGELAKNLRKLKKDSPVWGGTTTVYKIDASERSAYKDKTYHGVHFYVHERGKSMLKYLLRSARKKLKDK